MIVFCILDFILNFMTYHIFNPYFNPLYKKSFFLLSSFKEQLILVKSCMNLIQYNLDRQPLIKHISSSDTLK